MSIINKACIKVNMLCVAVHEKKKKHASAPSGSCLAWKPQNAPQVHNRWSHGDYHIHIKPTRVSFSFLTKFFPTTQRAQTEPKKQSWTIHQEKLTEIWIRGRETLGGHRKKTLKKTQSRQLREVQAPLSDFWKKFLVPRSTKACKKTLWCHYIAMVTPMSKNHES